MGLFGVQLTLLIGRTVPLPAPISFLEALEKVEVTHNDEGRSGFQIIFKANKGLPDFTDYGVLANPLLRPGGRVIMVVTFGFMPGVLMDGIITNHQLQPRNGDTPATLTITGEDVSVKMDMEERSVEHPAQPDNVIAMKIIATYAQYGLVPMVIPPLALDVPNPVERVPAQQATDLEYLQELAGRHGYVFYVIPGPAPGANIGYWGPPVRVGVPQRALSVDLGPETNVTQISFQNNATAPETVSGTVQDRQSNEVVPVQTVTSTRPPLAAQPALADQENVRRRQFRADGGLSAAQAQGQAQGRTDATSETITVEGELDTSRYGAALQARALVGLRGAGRSYDGLYYVKSVTHTLERGSYKQKFNLTRDGVGTTTPVVRP